MICDKCKAVISDEAKFCPKCGIKVELDLSQVNQMIKCPQCGADNPLSAKFCKVDGYNLQRGQNDQSQEQRPAEETLTCPICGTENSLTAKFCKKDGASLEPVTPLSTPPNIDQPVQIEPQKPETELEKQKNMVVCPTCGTENPATSKFCKKDGTPLEAEASNGVVTSADHERPTGEAKKGHDSTHLHATAPDVQGGRPKKWIWIVLIAVVLFACAAGGAFYYLGYIGMNPLRLQEIINNDLKSKGFIIAVTVDDKWVVKMEGTINDSKDKETAINIVRYNRYVKGVVDSIIILPKGPTESESTPAGEPAKVDEQAAQTSEETKPSTSQIPSVGGKPSTQSSSVSPDAVRKSVNSALKKKGFHNVYLEVSEDMRGVLKGYVYRAADRTSAIRIAKSRKELITVEDSIEVRPELNLKAQAAAIDPAKLEGDINRAMRNAGITGVNAEVKDNMTVILKGSVRSLNDKQQALQITNGFKQVKSVKDLIFVVGS